MAPARRTVISSATRRANSIRCATHIRSSYKSWAISMGYDHIFSGRGVVMVGGGEYFGPAIISIHMIRRTGSTLPVEAFAPNEKDAKLDIAHYQLNAPSLLFTSFAEILLLNSNGIALVNTGSDIFETEPYLSNGLIVWPDFWESIESPEFGKIAGLSNLPSDLPVTSSETGQLVWDKKRLLRPLLLETYYNVFGKDYYYRLLSQGAPGEGDKETFMAAAVVLQSTYYR